MAAKNEFSERVSSGFWFMGLIFVFTVITQRDGSENMLLSEISQRKTNADITYMWNLKKKKILINKHK